MRSELQNAGAEMHCLHCGFPNLIYQHCKIRCENCGFMLDCSDLDVGGEVKRARLAEAKAETHTLIELLSEVSLPTEPKA